MSKLYRMKESRVPCLPARLPPDSGPKPATKRLAWGNQQKWKALYDVIVVISMRLGGVYRLKKDFKVIIWGEPQRSGTIFYGESWPIERPSKYFRLAIGGGLGWMKLLKNGVGKGFIFHAIITALYPFSWKFYWLSETTFIFSTLESQSLKTK